MSTPTLFPDQQIFVDGIRDAFRAHRTVLGVAPTGFGKTVTFAYIAKGAEKKGRRVLVLAHRQELLDQISDALARFYIRHGFIAAGYPSDTRAMVQVGSTQTVVRRTAQMQRPDLIVVDEAHHATKKNTLGQVLAAFPKAHVLGVTATPVRLSGEGMGEVFGSMVLGPSTADLIDAGRLAPVKVYAPPGIDTSGLHMRGGDYAVGELVAAADKPQITGDAVDHYRRLADGKRAVAFCISVEHAQHVANAFCAAGYSAVRIDGGMERHERRRIVEAFRQGEVSVLTSCDLVSEGFDLPAIECGISLRPTASTGLWLQQVGRCLRIAPGKSHAIVLDHAGNTLRHGLPTEPRDWSLDGREPAGKRDTAERPISVRVCSVCFSANRAGVSVCGSCGHPFPVQSRKVASVEGELQEITAVRVLSPEQSRAKQEQGTAQSLQALIELAKMRGYKAPERWAQYVYEGRQAKQSRLA